MKKIIVLGASGSIGTQTLDVIKSHQDKFELVGLSVGKNIDRLIEILKCFDVKNVCVQNKYDYEMLKKDYPLVNFYYGERGLIELVQVECDIVLNALVGLSGLKPTVAAIKLKRDIALANKETLVVAGELMKNLVKEYGVKLLPVDSEHSAIFQCLEGKSQSKIRRLILTASGGSFRDKTREELKYVTVKDALKHPNWSMGNKITIDSATMMNKGFEVIEAHYLFDVDYDDIEVVLHRQSVIHSMVEFEDYSILAQLGTPDMKLPIQYALNYPNRIKLYNSKPLDFSSGLDLNFQPMDFKRFVCLDLAYKVGRIKGSLPCVLNAANEVLVNAFLEGKCTFLDIERYLIKIVDEHQIVLNPSLDDLIEIDQKTRELTHNLLKGDN